MISLIVAMSKNGVIGYKNTIPWHLPDDLKRFKRITMGHTVVMGRHTFTSIGKPLEGRKNVVLSSLDEYAPIGVKVVKSLPEAFKEEGDIFVIGGAQVYKDALPNVDKMYITQIEHEVVGDTYFPAWNKSEWVEIEREEKHFPFPYSYITLVRI